MSPFCKFIRLIGESAGGLVLPEFYHLDNPKSPATLSNFLSRKSINSIFASASLGYKGFAFMDAALCNDWSLTLPKGNDSYLYPSVVDNFLFWELLKQEAGWI